MKYVANLDGTLYKEHKDRGEPMTLPHHRYYLVCHICSEIPIYAVHTFSHLVIPLSSMDFIDGVLQWAIFMVRAGIATAIGIVKACVPRGYLPRKDVKGEICLITGAESGIGRLMAIEFAKLGCTMVLWDVNSKGNEETKDLLRKTGVMVYTYTVDLSMRDQINATAQRVLKEVGTVDILINNAGVVTGKTLTESSDECIERSMAVNASACIYMAKNFVKPMIEKNHGHIVTIASIAGKIGGPRVVDYCASKFAAVGFHESLAAELQHTKSEGIKTTLVCPYFINTGMFAGAENKAQRLVSILEPDYAVDCIMEAVLTNKAELIMPKTIYAILAILQLLPTEAKHILCEYFGQYDSMDNFVGRQEKL